MIKDRLLSALSRISTQRFIPEIDGLRFIAIMSVVFYHLQGYFQKELPNFIVISEAGRAIIKIFGCGHFGVHLFFVISGCILSLPFAVSRRDNKQAPSLSQYFARRLTRIEPPYIIAMLIYFVSILAIGKVSFQELLPHLLASLVYLHGAIYNTVSAVCPVAWSLEVEVQFYILAPLLTSIFVVKDKNLRRLILLVAIFIAASNSAHASTFSIVKHAHLFLLGFLLTDFYAFEWQEKDKSYKWDLPCLLGWLGLLIVVPNYWYLEYTFPFFVFLAYAGALRGKLCAQFFRHPWIVTIGGMCYTIYLYHFYIISALGRFSCKLIIGQSYMLNLVLQALILVPLLLAISALLFFLFEKPFMRRDWADRLLNIFRPFLPQNKALQNLGD